MGWKGAVRSISAASNAAARESERANKQAFRESERLRKKYEKIVEKKEKIDEALNLELAKGKIDHAKHDELEKRMDDISDELIVFGKAAGVALGKRYVCGKIEKEEFETIRSEIVPEKLYQEKDQIIADVSNKQNKCIVFAESCSKSEGVCQKCGKEKGLFSPIKEIDEMKLCGKCSAEFKKMRHYDGFSGEYIKADPCEVEDKMQLHISIRQEHL